jgi:flagellar hook assembly protein FlgD
MRIRLELFDVMGRQVRTLAKGDALEGSTDIAWDGRDGKGRAAASGVYFARLVCRAGVRTVRVPLVR